MSGPTIVERLRGPSPDTWIKNGRLLVEAADTIEELLEALRALQLQAVQSDLMDAANEWGREAIDTAASAIAKATQP